MQEKLEAVAERWDMTGGELKALVEMTSSAPWARVMGILRDVKRKAERDLREGENMQVVSRAQGTLWAVESFQGQVDRYIESYKEAMRDDTQ